MKDSMTSRGESEFDEILHRCTFGNTSVHLFNCVLFLFCNYSELDSLGNLGIGVTKVYLLVVKL